MRSKFILTREKIAQMFERSRHSSQSKTTWLMLLLLTVFAWQCKKDDYKGETKGVCPQVVSTIPGTDTTNVLVRTKVTVLFNEAMNPSTINTTTFSLVKATSAVATTKAASTPLLGTVTYAGMTATLTLDTPLDPATKYTGTVTKGAQDPDGNALKADYIWSFTTAPLYTVALTANPLLSGTMTGAGSFNLGDSVTVVGTPNAGFTFSNWTDGATVVSPNAIYKFKLSANRTLVANYSAIPYTVAISSLPLLSGTTTGAGIFNSGASVTVTAVPSVGFVFANWTEGATIVSADASYVFTLMGNKTLVAHFNAVVYTVAVSSLPVAGGTTTGTGVFNSGASVTVKAVPAVGYSFTNWTDGAAVASTDANYTFTISSNKTLVAHYAVAAAKYTLALSSNPLLGGTTSGAGSFNSGASVTATAVKNLGYTFTNWKEGANIVSTNAIYTFPISGNRTLVANFTLVPVNNFTLDVTAANGTVLANPDQPTYLQGASVVLTATPDPGFTFTSWGGDANGSVNPLTVVMNANKNITANFTMIPSVGPAPIDLGSAADFSALTKSGVSTIGVTSIEGNIGVSPASATAITGFGLIMDANNQSSHTPIVSGKVYASDYATPTPTKMTVAVADMENAFNVAMGLVVPAPIVDLHAGNISGRTLATGLYKWSTGLLVTNAGVTLNGGPNDVWVFQISQNLTIDNNAIIHLTGGAQAKNVFWIVKGQATLGSDTDFSGIILSKTLISLNTNAKVTGRLLAQTAVTFNTSTVVLP